jgi:hypothetical protein
MSGMQKNSCSEVERVKVDRSLTEVSVNDVRRCEDLMKMSERQTLMRCERSLRRCLDVDESR